MSELRKKFEALPDIADKLHTVEFTESHNTYHAKLANSSLSVKFVQGAWYALQEQQSKIEQLEKRIASTLEMANAWKSSNTDGMMSPSMRHIMLACASEVEEALRGDHE